MSLAPIPVHGALDNLAACRRAQAIIKWVDENPGLPFPLLFELMHDGDLWKLFFNNLVARGPCTIKIVKVKGHDSLAADENPDEDRLRNIQGNNKSDELAKRASRDYGPQDVIALGNYLVWRNETYIKFIAAVHKVLVRMHIAAHRLRHQPAFRMQYPQANAHRPQLVTYRQLCFPSDHNSSQTNICVLECCVTKQVVDDFLSRANPLVRGAWHMLTHCKIVAHPIDEPGLTWHEFLALASLWSPDEAPRLPHRSARSAPRLAQIINVFKRDVLHMFKVLVHPTMHSMLRINYHGVNRLQGLGITNRVQHVSFLPCICNDACVHISLAILSINKALPARLQRSIRSGRAVMLRTKLLTGQGSLKWQKHLDDARQLVTSQHQVVVQPYSPPQAVAPMLQAVEPISMFMCPNGHGRAATTPAFDPLKPHKCTWCAGCRKYLGGKKWMCPCKVPWSSCPHHVSVLVPVALPNRKRRTQAIPAMTESEAAQKLARIEAPTCSRIILSPKLAARFPHLARPS